MAIITRLVRAIQARKVLLTVVEAKVISLTSFLYSICHDTMEAVSLSVLAKARIVLFPAVATIL